ncbi:putative uncharacterized protein DDB_G0282499 [Linepithema humile]|uniref:putative uncharacterized protein DDB_G0282499 n=1 Tax=Linepithema humile TaxID=83485 RepID=UPI000623A682|nr:PREDICTED: myb-like protein D [Linepithema humile]
MKKSPLNSPYDGRAYGARSTPYWKLQENANSRGYQGVENNSYHRLSVNNGPQTCGGDFIPLNISTPVGQHRKNNANQYNTGCSSPRGGWRNRNNYQNTPKSNCNNRYTAYNQFYGQKSKGFKGGQRQANISAYVDINSFFEDPWEGLMKKLNDSNHKSEMLNDKSLSNPKLADSDSVEKFDSKLQEDTNLNNSQYNQKSENESSNATSFNTENTDLSQVSKSNSSIDLGADT